jgi:hypothetical protein
LHLFGGLVRERHRHDLVAFGFAQRQDVGDAARQNPRLAAARAGQDAQWAGRDQDGLALGRIEVG